MGNLSGFFNHPSRIREKSALHGLFRAKTKAIFCQQPSDRAKFETDLEYPLVFRFTLMSLLACVFYAIGPAFAGPWPQWRGPQSSGVSEEPEPPVSWNATQGIRWKRPLQVQGFSSPIVWGDRIFLTGVDEKNRIQVLSLRRSDGEILWQKDFEPTATAHGLGGYHNAASPTPVTDGHVVVTFFATGDLIAVDFDGKLLWKRSLVADYGELRNGQGMAASPILWENRCYLLCDHSQSYLLALDPGSGKTIWKKDRPLRDSWSTPVVFRSDQDQNPELVTCSSEWVFAYHPLTGEDLWSCKGVTASVAPSPVFGNGLIFATSGRNGPTLAIRPGGRGDVTSTHIEWRQNRGGPYVPSPILYRDHFYQMSDNGVCTCLQALNGQVLWKERLDGRFTASPIAAGGNLFFLSEAGDTFVLDAGRTFRLRSTNSLGELCMASPAISEEQIFIRTDKHLVCIGREDSGEAGVPAVAGRQKQDLTTLIELLKSTHVTERIRAAEALGNSANSEALPELTRVMRQDHWDVSEVAIKAIARLGKPSIPVLLESLGDSRPFIRWEAAAGLGQIADSSTAETLAKALGDSNAVVRSTAAEALGRVGGPAAVSGLQEALKDKEGSVRQAAIAALGSLAAKEAIPALLQKLNDEDRLVKRTAIEVLARWGGDSVRSAFEELRSHEADAALRGRLGELLSEMKKE